MELGSVRSRAVQREVSGAESAAGASKPVGAARVREDLRFHAFDNLRAWMMLLLIPFHAVLPFMTVPSLMRFNDPAGSVLYDGLALYLLSFRRPVFFVVGGFFAAMLLERRGPSGMLANRAQRVLAPLVLGWIVLAPVTQAAYEFALAAVSTQRPAAGFAILRDWSWLNWERPFHLWFLMALLLFYGVALGTRWALPRILGARIGAYERQTRRFLQSPWRPLVLAGVLAICLVPSEFLPYNRGNPLLAVSLALFFGLGWRMYVHRDLLETQTRGAWAYVALGTALLPLATWAKWKVLHGSAYPLAWTLASGLVGSLMSGLLVFGTIGVFLRHANDHRPALRYLSDASYWVYLAHMPALVFLGGWLATTALPASIKVTSAVALTTLFTLVTYAACVRHTAIGRLLNGTRPRNQSVAGSSV